MSVRIQASLNTVRRVGRPLLTALAGAVIIGSATSVSPAAAQTDGSLRTSLELRPFVGAFIPTGREHRDFVKDAFLLGAQASWAFSRSLAVTGNFGWAPSESRPSFVFPVERRLNVYQYDVGLEGRSPSAMANLTGFGGLGIGGRTYHIRDVGTKTNLDGYIALGGDYSFGRTAVRIEGRDYISQFRPFFGGERKTRNDVTISAGMTFRM